VHLGLQPGPQPRQLGPVPDGLSQLADLRGRHPRLGEPTHPQQVRQQRGVAQVVLHPPVLVAGDPQRMRQMQSRPHALITSAAQYHPQVASVATSAVGPLAATISRVRFSAVCCRPWTTTPGPRPRSTRRSPTAAGEGRSLRTIPSGGGSNDRRWRVRIGFERTFEQDAAFGIRQLVDIGLRMASPAVNDPYTAEQSVYHITAVLCASLGGDLGPQVWRDGTGTPRVFVPKPASPSTSTSLAGSCAGSLPTSHGSSSPCWYCSPRSPAASPLRRHWGTSAARRTSSSPTPGGESARRQTWTPSRGPTRPYLVGT
jgi:Predicted membrane protein (DUF2254)